MEAGGPGFSIPWLSGLRGPVTHAGYSLSGLQVWNGKDGDPVRGGWGYERGSMEPILWVQFSWSPHSSGAPLPDRVILQLNINNT